MGYIKCHSWRFNIEGEPFEIRPMVFTHDMWEVEEIEKNGQEDTHFYGAAWRGKLIEGREHLDRYRYKGFADKMEAFFTEHGMPQD